MSIFEQSLSAFHKLCNSTFYLIVVNKFIQVILVSVGGIMVSIAAFQAVDPGSIPGRRNFFFLPNDKTSSPPAENGNASSFSSGRDSSVGRALD